MSELERGRTWHHRNVQLESDIFDRDLKIKELKEKLEKERLQHQTFRDDIFEVQDEYKNIFLRYKSECDGLKAELGRMTDDFVKNELDRVTWKSRCEKMSESVKTLHELLSPNKNLPHGKGLCFYCDLLAEFEKGV